MKGRRLILVIENVRSVFNVASLFRTADGAGVENILLVGYTPAPIDRFGRARKDFAKVSLGAEKNIPWESFPDIEKAIEKLKKEGFICAALEQSKGSVHYLSAPKGDVALVVGNEVEGVSKEALKMADVLLEIPMRGKKESLNVEVAGAIALFALRDQL